MKTRAAVLNEMSLPRPYAQSRPLHVVEVELDPPGPGEVLVRMHAAGLCHSDLSAINDDINAAFDRLPDGKSVRQIVTL